jgi:hypothetical protein
MIVRPETLHHTMPLPTNSCARGEHGLKLIATLKALGFGGPYKKPKMRTYVDDHGRAFEPCEVETEWELERDENGNVAPCSTRGATWLQMWTCQTSSERNKLGCNVPPRGVLKT